MDVSSHSDRPDWGAAAVIRAVCERCITEVGVDHTGVVVSTGDGLWSSVYSTSAVAAELDVHAFTLGEGPCYDVLSQHAPQLVSTRGSDLSKHFGRWPLWGAEAARLGVRSVTALPLQAGAITTGVLTLLSASPEPLAIPRLREAQRLADIAFLGLLDVFAGLQNKVDGNGHAPGERAANELGALVRADVHQAAGMIMGQAGIPIEHALARLRAFAFSSGRPIEDVAADVLARRIRFQPDTDSAQ